MSTNSNRDDRILGLAALVRSVAARYGGSDDVTQAAWIGAIEAVDRHDASRGPLTAFAHRRIAGAVQDHFRAIDDLSRDARSKVKSGAAPAPHRVSLAVAEAARLASVTRPHDRLPRHKCPACARMHSVQRCPHCGADLNALTKRELAVCQISARGMLHKEAAAELGISEATLSCHIENIKKKLGIRGTPVHFVLQLMRLKIIPCACERVAGETKEPC